MNAFSWTDQAVSADGDVLRNSAFKIDSRSVHTTLSEETLRDPGRAVTIAGLPRKRIPGCARKIGSNQKLASN